MTVLSLSITASNNDAEQAMVGGAVALSGAAINCTDGTTRGGFRFVNVGIPQGATINSATLDVVCIDAANDSPQCDIWGQNSDDAPVFTTDANNISSRPATSAYTNWTASDIGTAAVQSPAITAVIQEIVNRPGWVSGNAIAIFIQGLTGTGFQVHAYDGVPANAVKLNIDFSGTEYAQSVSGVLSSTGAVTKTAQKALAGTLTGTGALAMAVTAALVILTARARDFLLTAKSQD
jgi:hypothetical protein